MIYGYDSQYLDELSQQQQDDAIMSLIADAAADGYAGLEPRLPEDGDYMYGWAMGSNARLRMKLQVLERGQMQLIDHLAEIDSTMTATLTRTEEAPIEEF
jgi:hypothetical protein